MKEINRQREREREISFERFVTFVFYNWGVVQCLCSLFALGGLTVQREGNEKFNDVKEMYIQIYKIVNKLSFAFVFVVNIFFTLIQSCCTVYYKSFLCN